MPFTSALSDEQKKKLVVDYEDGFKIIELAKRYSISVSTVYRYLAAAGQMQIRDRRYKRKAPAREPRVLMPCGTDAAYRRHKRKNEYPCSACLEAHSAVTAKYR